MTLFEKYYEFYYLSVILRKLHTYIHWYISYVCVYLIIFDAYLHNYCTNLSLHVALYILAQNCTAHITHSPPTAASCAQNLLRIYVCMTVRRSMDPAMLWRMKPGQTFKKKLFFLLFRAFLPVNRNKVKTLNSILHCLFYLEPLYIIFCCKVSKL